MQEIKLTAEDVKFRFTEGGRTKLVALVADLDANEIHFMQIDEQTLITDKQGVFAFNDHSMTMQERMLKIEAGLMPVGLLQEVLAKPH